MFLCCSSVIYGFDYSDYNGRDQICVIMKDAEDSGRTGNLTAILVFQVQLNTIMQLSPLPLFSNGPS